MEGLSSLTDKATFLQKHCGQGTVLLIDEYDVPLDKACQGGYYDAMVELPGALFGQALKTNSSLKKEMKENFYHGILPGLLGNMGWKVKSNAEAGDGYSDITAVAESASLLS